MRILQGRTHVRNLLPHIYYIDRSSASKRMSLIACGTCFLYATSVLATLTVADLPMSGGVLQDKTVYKVTRNTTLSKANSSALIVASNATAVIYISSGVTLTCRGANASSNSESGQPGILVPKGSSLYVTLKVG